MLAHPERAARAGEPGGIATLRSLLDAGAVAQVNVCSLLGNNGLRVQETAVALLRSGLAYVIASDGHPGTREHTVALGFTLAQRAGASSVQAWRLTQANPRFLLDARHPRRALGGDRSKRSRSRSTERSARADEGACRMCVRRDAAAASAQSRP